MVFGHYISEQRHRSFTLQAAQELQNTQCLMERATDAVFWLTPNAQIVYVNQAACDLVGYSREQLLSLTLHEIDPNFSPNLWSEYWKAIEQQGSLYFESLYQTQEGCSFPVEITITYLNYYGKEYGSLSIRDITKRKQIEVALQRANETLEREIKERTLQLRNTNEQLCREVAERQRAEAELKKSLSLLHTTLESTVNNAIATMPSADRITITQPGQPFAQSQWYTVKLQQVSEQPSADTAKPTTPQSIFPSNPKLREVFHFIEANYHQSITLSDVAEAVGYSPAYLTDLVRRQTGKTVNRWIVERRIAQACSLLRETDQSVDGIAEAVGYQNAGHFFRQFRQYRGTTPQAWRNSQRSESSAQ
jgi:PAS domain S-box-containing protein